MYIEEVMVKYISILNEIFFLMFKKGGLFCLVKKVAIMFLSKIDRFQKFV